MIHQKIHLNNKYKSKLLKIRFIYECKYMFDIFKLIFTILFASYVYNNSKLGTYSKKYIMQCILSTAYNTIYYYSSFEIQINRLMTLINPYIDLLQEYLLDNTKSIYIIEK